MSPIVGLRLYTLHPGRRDRLIALFDREFVETQEVCDATVLGQFRDLDNPDRFGWVRGFDTMAARENALARFYGGPAWKSNAAEANATMIDSDNVLLLKVSATDAFPAPRASRTPVTAVETPSSAIVATIYYGDRPFDAEFLRFFDDRLRPALLATGIVPFVYLSTEYAENMFPALPARTGENVFVWFARFESVTDAHAAEKRFDVPSELVARTSGEPERLRLAPTARSLLR
jgi:hypothetical protein